MLALKMNVCHHFREMVGRRKHTMVPRSNAIPAPDIIASRDSARIPCLSRYLQANRSTFSRSRR